MKIKTATLLFIMTLSLFGGLIVSATFNSLSNTYEIDSLWDGFQANHSHKARALNALYSEIGYGGMIHNFKNYLIRHKQENADAVKSSLGGAKAAISLYRSLNLNQLEIEALRAVEANLTAYENVLPVIATLIEKSQSVRNIDQQVKVNDAAALSGLRVLLEQSRLGHAGSTSRSEVVSQIRRALGFGGMIHQFKNAILRNDKDALDRASGALNQATAAIQKYLAFDLNSQELLAIRNIQNVISNYSAKIQNAKKLDLSSMTVGQIDKLVQVDDRPALLGFETLDKQIINFSEQAEENLSHKLNLVISAQNQVLYLTVFTIMLFIVGGSWLLRFQILKPILSLTTTMKDIVKGEHEGEITGVEKQDEIGDMARALEVFHENMYLLECTKAELYAANMSLEHRVKERTQALQNSEQRLKAILETAVDAIIIIDENGCIQSFNRAAEIMFGYTANEVLSNSVNLLMPESFKPYHNQHIQNYLVSGGNKAIGHVRELEAQRKNGERFPIHVSVSEVKSSQGISFTGIIRDISELKAFQQELQISKEAAVKANTAKSEFVSGMSHELRTPLNAIMGFTQLLECNSSEPLTDNQKEAVSEIKAAGEHLLSIINQILDLNKIEAGKMPINLKQVSPSQAIQESLALIVQKATEVDVELVDQVEYESLPDLLTDEVRFKQVLINLLSNAVKYNKVGGKIVVDAAITNQKVRFSVSDTGKGIPLYRHSQIFLPFERLGHESGEIEGTGIGLSITKNIVTQMQGSIGFDSQEGEGSCFWFELPVFQQEK